MARAKKTTKSYVLLVKHYGADDRRYEAGETIELTPAQAVFLANKIRDPELPVQTHDPVAAARIADLEAQVAALQKGGGDAPDTDKKAKGKKGESDDIKNPDGTGDLGDAKN